MTVFHLRTSCAASAAVLLTVLMASAKQPIQLASSPALSPDGKRLAFSHRGDIWLAAATGGVAKPMTRHPATDSLPAFSPDGRSLAFISSREGGSQVYVMPVDGGTPRQVTHHSEGYTLEGWSSDGTQLLVSGARDHFWRNTQRFFFIDAERRSGEKPLFDAYGSEPSLSDDGNRLLFVREGERWWRKGYEGSRSAQIWMWEKESGEFTRLLDEPADCRWPMWLPNNRSFYYVSGELGAYNLCRYDFDVKQESDRTRQLTQFRDDSVVFPDLSEDGSLIVFRRLFDLYRFRPNRDKQPQKLELFEDGDEEADDLQRVVSSRASEAAFSDDALEIAMIAGDDLWVMDTVLKEPRQITSSPESESDPVFSRDGETIFFISNQEGQSDIWKAQRAETKKYWWLNENFTLTRLTQDAEVENELRLSPDGKQIYYIRKRGDLWGMNLDGSEARRIFEGFDRPEFSISPDGKWVAYAQYDNDFNRDVWLAPVDGSKPSFNLSRHPDDDYGPVWSPDGRLLAFTGQRREDEVDVYYVWLQKEEEDKTRRARTLEKALEKVKQARRSSTTPGQKPPVSKSAAGEAEKKDDGQSKDLAATQAKSSNDSSAKPVRIDFEGIHERIHRISNANSRERGLFFSSDSKKLAFSATVSGKSGLYTVEFPGQLTPKLLTSSVGSNPRWLKKPNVIAWVSTSGTPATVSTSGQATSYSFRASQAVSPSARRVAAFDLCWRVMRDSWYDERMGNRNWDAIRRKYRDAAAAAPNRRTLRTIVELMLGELNGSHLGFTVRSGSSSAGDQWNASTAHLGLRFDPNHLGPGLLVKDVVPDGPGDKTGSSVTPGEVVLSIDGVTVDPAMDLTEVLNGRLDRDIRLRVRSQQKEGAEAEDSDEQQSDDKQSDEAPTTDETRDVVLRPISYSAARSLLYQKWLKDNQQMVSQLSDQRLGYIHIRSMDQTSFIEFERQLYAVGFGKDGLVIDVRENGGGSTTDLLLTALTQPVHAIAVPRGGGNGYPQSRKVFATWNKPIIVMCNQNSFSNAEIFAHSIKTLDRGQVVGVPTAGGVISTGGTSIMDIGYLRKPFRGWFVLETGEDMELNGAVPDYVVWPEPGQIPSGKDVQIEKAVEVLLSDVEQWLARPQPKLRYNTQR